MAPKTNKAPLYRKVNTQARGVPHRIGGDYRAARGAMAATGAGHAPMHGKTRRGLDYTPLFKFLLSKVGCDWTGVHSEAAARLDHPDPIFWMVARAGDERRELVRMGESTHYSGLFVDEDGILRKVNPGLRPEHLTPSCACCTHTFNGVRFGPRP